MIRVALTLLLLFSVSCVTNNPECKFSGIETLYETVDINLSYSEKKPREVDIKVFTNAIIQYGIGKKVVITQKEVESKTRVWTSPSLEAYYEASKRKVKKKPGTLFLDFYHLPGIYIHGDRPVVGLANVVKDFIAVFYDATHKICLKFVMIHELMHIVGMEHCNNKLCIMFPSIKRGQRVLKLGCMEKLQKIILDNQ